VEPALFIYAVLTFALERPMEWVPASLAFLVALLVVLVTMPPLIRKMVEGGMVGRDVNKRHRPEVAELGGIAALFAFAISLSVVVGIEKLAGDISEPPFLAAIAVFFIASMIGLIDDISNLKQRVKAVVVVFAALPLLLVHSHVSLASLAIPGQPIVGTINISENAFIRLPLDGILDLTSTPFLYWFVLVPIGVTGVANAMNMSAGYNGLESGQIAIVSASLLGVSAFKGTMESLLIFAALLGAAAGMFWYNRHPARMFVGDIGSLGMGAAIAAGAILGGVEVWGLIAIAPAFYEAGATLWYGGIRRISRREACHSPNIDEKGRLSPPTGAERYTLAYFILGKRPMTEPRLVLTLLSLYAISGLVAVALSLV
jgi:UDP-N-acetylglucosamine--dolichyl-phosphate N-acetylglucosaminephosphotransferase